MAGLGATFDTGLPPLPRLPPTVPFSAEPLALDATMDQASEAGPNPNPRVAADFIRRARATSAGLIPLPVNVSWTGQAKVAVKSSPHFVVEAFRGLATKLSSFCGYKKRLRALADEVETTQKAIDEASQTLPSLSEQAKAVTAKRIIYLQRDLEKSVRDYRELKESRFRLLTASNSALESSGSVMKLAGYAGRLTGTISGAAATALNYTIPGLGIVTSCFWAVFGGVKGIKAWKTYQETRAELQQCEAELFLTDDANRSRANEFLAKNMDQIPSGEPTFRKRMALRTLVQREYKGRLRAFEESPDGIRLSNRKRELAAFERDTKQKRGQPEIEQHRALLKAQIEILEGMRPRPIPITLKTMELFRAERPLVPLTPLSARCAAVRKAFLEKRVAVLSQESRKQMVRVCHYALHVGLAVLTIAAGALAIGATAGAATPLVAGAATGLFVVILSVEGGLFGTDMATSIFDRLKGTAERKTPRALAAAQLAHELSLLPPQDRDAALATASISIEAKGILPDSQEEIELQILKAFALFSGAEIEQIAISMNEPLKQEQRTRLLRSVGLDPRANPSLAVTEYIGSLAHEIAGLDVGGQEDALRSLGLLPEEGLADKMTEEDLLRYLTSQLSLLFPKDEGEKTRHLLASYGIEEFLTPAELAAKVFALPEEKRGVLLKELGIPTKTAKGRSLTQGLLGVRLKGRFPFLFPKVPATRPQAPIELPSV
jgi:hypothetical protein